MKPKIIFVERKPSASVSIERVFRQIAKDLPPDRFDIEFQSVPFGNGIAAIIKNLLFFRKVPGDIYHITGDIHYMSLVLPRKKTILTIHDLVFLRRRTGLRRFVLKKLFLDLPIRRVRKITTVSEQIKREITELSLEDIKKVEVIENPVFKGFNDLPEKSFNELSPIILHIGTAANKNLPNLITALEGLVCNLKIIGQLDDKIVEILKLSRIKYENVAELDDAQIVEEYRNADIVSFCSVYEGFGLPIVEAQAMRKPVITSDLAPMNNVAGEGAVLVDPSDPISIRTGIERVLFEPEYRAKLIESGERNVQRFDGKPLAKRYAAIYEQILSESDSTL